MQEGMERNFGSATVNSNDCMRTAAVILDLEAELQPAVDALMPLVASVQNI
jgi:hypothetical protein